MQSVYIKETVARALAEDLGSGDVTAEVVYSGEMAHARITCNENAVLAGVAWADECFRQLQPDVVVDWGQEDGDQIEAGTVVCDINGRARAMLSAERTALNFLGLLSGTATTTRRFVDAVAGTRAKILDTRKTLPGLRLAQKHAVRCAGGFNHRMGLYDMVLIKENHISAAGGIADAIAAARVNNVNVLIECEVESFEELQQAVVAGADRIMLDGFSDADIAKAVTFIDHRIPLEVSGGMDLERVQEIARTGVEFISVGAITKQVQAIDFSQRFI